MATTEHKRHVFQEKATKDPLLVSFSRADKLALHEVIFAISQSNMDKLVKVLEDVSDPSSFNYGKHWSKSEVAEFTANKEGYKTVTEYLQSREEIVVNRQTLHGEYIFATAPVHVWEDIFATTFHAYQVSFWDSDGKPQEEQIIRTEEYSLPVELNGHVSTVLNTVQFHGKNAIENRFKPDANILRSDSKQEGIIHPSKETSPVELVVSPGRSNNRESTLAASLVLNKPLHVPYYSTSDTASATVNTVSFTFTTCSSGYLYIADCDPNRCSSSNNDQYIRLYTTLGDLPTAVSNDYCNQCSAIGFSQYLLKCRTYTLRQGCFGSSQCSGNFTITLFSSQASVPTPQPMTRQPSRQPTLPQPSRQPTSAQPSGLYDVGSVTPRFINQYYQVSSNYGNLQVSQSVPGFTSKYSPSDLTTFQQTFGLPQQAPKTNQQGGASSAGSNLQVQYIMGIAQGVDTTYETSDSDSLSSWITSVSNTNTPANVYAIRWGWEEYSLSTSVGDLFNTEAIKLGVMGTTILAASGIDGVLSRNARVDSTYCGYSPLFPASSPYVVAVGGTMVSILQIMLIASICVLNSPLYDILDCI